MKTSLRCRTVVSSQKFPRAIRAAVPPCNPWSPMSHAYVIECGELAAGIVTRESRGFIFHAAADAFLRLNGQTFQTPQEAQRAAENLRRKKRPRARS
ncbi:hypothetical protein M2323_000965 [Rhodoblastus acidophilus]|uniref:hypothetical protein n=1 Tax=Rhodoblastus acidophilus TaxID=1074 RepID=UPI0029CAB109|nr:hypothetical protein [Rhodoblastus acidophilus]MCW2283196.1 hypothetical protein [Rhodoblastus acidophilus]MCW2332056.1 hypothetical protein [Rhodoblastus acidophilus]